ncbi:MAG TPA: arsenite methyltransferase [Anaerolineales bacterium]|nr:arsenite methyltransferase [Anaerolineales bacterium]HMX74771.1 arsenite methyltransferase [Anaerolineales bacterium]HMZ44015.1 arsenite methyltransferase [Anaerolineales bacterium]HNA53824.1 arsenite methyltransferase [Anaerolineales bacterium]HNC88633.1 arsenite methyltransferase [Anaerolineales bacterium]
MTQSPTPIHETVREHYAERIKSSASCCGPSDCCTPNNILYPEQLLTTVPSDVASTSYGCGDPITLASLKPGQTVLDLGSGAGLDCILAAQKVGESGHVIGVDMTPEMIERATANAKKVHLTNVEFRQGYLEDLPVESNTVDVIISNCVINLSPDKEKVFTEAFRVLAPGGKLAVSDIVTAGILPEPVRQSLSAWAGCVAGAVQAEEYIAMMNSVGFTDISITPVFFDKEFVESAIAEMNLDVSNYPREEIYKAIFSAKITAYKPA